MEALSRALERGRDRYNALFAEARARYPELEGDDFLDHLARRVGPLLQALPAGGTDAEDRALAALFRASLEMLGRQLGGRRAHTPFINAVWEMLLPRVGGLLAVAPWRVAAAMTNAAGNLAAEPGARPREWIDRMARVAGQCADVDALVAAGQVAAWRSGMAHFRSGALARCARLPESLIRPLLDVPREAPADWLDRLSQHPFLRFTGPPAALVFVGRLGGFRGFGGVFLTPPSLGRRGNRIVAFDRESAWEVHADGYGAILRRSEFADATKASKRNARRADPVPTLSPEGEVRSGELVARFPGLAAAAFSEAEGELLAVTLPESHHVYLVALVHGQAC